MINQKVAIVSGASRGIGLEIARKLFSEGFFVIQTSRSVPKKQDIFCEHFVCDSTNKDQTKLFVETVLSKFGRIDLLVCNSGSGKPQNLESSLDVKIRKSIEENLIVAVNMIESLLDSLKKSKGCVIGISSIVATSNMLEAPLEYSISKSALEKYFKVMSLKYASKSIRFHLIAPGNVMFPGSVWEEKLQNNKNEIQNYISKKVPTGRFIHIDEITDTVLFLAKKATMALTGSIFLVDGGQNL
jgi:3-oxoacyl-[acyl-carrier protein] reductase